jgi:hypothetical protein
MNETQLIQRRLISPEDIEQIRALMIENPKWHRTRLSIEICRLWNWIDAIGRLNTWPAALYCLSRIKLQRWALPSNTTKDMQQSGTRTIE